MSYSFSAATEIVGGLGSISQLGSTAERFNPSAIVVVADEGVVRAGLVDEAIESIRAHDPRVCTPVRPDPTTDAVEAIAAEAIQYGADLVIAIGGGSALAAGKAVALRLRNENPITEYAGRDQAVGGAAPTIAIPTTAGSGSEVSNALVLHDPRRPLVLVVRGRGYEPRVAILDGMLIRSLPREPFIYAGLDALSHALEALWVKRANPFTDAMALAAADIIYGVLPRALEERRPEDLQALLEASAMANIACGSSELGLVHALSLSTAVHLPHGYQNAVLMPHVAAYNRDSVSPVAVAQLDRLEPLYEQIGFAARFRPGELSSEAAESMVTVAMMAPLSQNNVRGASASQLREILSGAGAPALASSVDA